MPQVWLTDITSGQLISIHGHPLAVPAKFAISSRRNRSATVANSRALLESEQLLGTEGLVVDLGGGFDEILQVSAGQEVAQVNELAVVLILNLS